MLEKLTTAYFSQEYENKDEMALAFSVYNKKWTRHARKNKLSQKLFEQIVKQVLIKTAENENNK